MSGDRGLLAATGMEMLCSFELRDSLFLDARELQRDISGEGEVSWNIGSFDEDYDEAMLAEYADHVIVLGDAAKRLYRLGYEWKADELYDLAEQSLVHYLAILWDVLLPVERGGSPDHEHIEPDLGIPEEWLGLDSISLADWRETKTLRKDSAELMDVCARWWDRMRKELEEMGK